MKINNKQTMYRMLQNGQFGNTIPQYNSIAEWVQKVNEPYKHLWRVRSLKKSSHGAKLNVAYFDVENTAHRFFNGHVNISPMIDKFVIAMLQLTWADGDMWVSGVLNPKFDEGWNWINSMCDPSRFQEWKGVLGLVLLQSLLNENSMDDLRLLMQRFPESTIEMSVTNKCVGSVPHRNAIIWEVRNY